MGYTVSMDKSGRIVIPMPVRKRLGAEGITRFDLDIILNRIELTPHEDSRAKPRVVEKGGIWVVTGTGKSSTSVVDAIRQDREGRMEHLSSKGNRAEK